MVVLDIDIISDVSEILSNGLVGTGDGENVARIKRRHY